MNISLKRAFVFSFALLLSLPVITSRAFAKDYHLKVTEKGFQPAKLSVPAGEDVTLKVTRTAHKTCAKAMVIPSRKMEVKLPLNQEVSVPLGKLAAGEIKFSCSMDMEHGVIIVQ